MLRKIKCADIWKRLISNRQNTLTEPRHFFILQIKKWRSFFMENKFLDILFRYSNPINIAIGLFVCFNFLYSFYFKTQQIEPEMNKMQSDIEYCRQRTNKLELDLSTNTAEIKAYLAGIQADLQVVKMEITANGLRHNGYSINR